VRYDVHIYVIRRQKVKRKEYFQQSFGLVILAVLSKYGLYLIRLLYFVMFFDSCVCVCVCVCVVCSAPLFVLTI
jgi:hypothetical protein